MTQPALKPLTLTSDELYATLLRLMDKAETLLAYWDKDKTCVFANEAYLTFLGRTREQAIGGAMETLLGSLYAQSLPSVQSCYKGYSQIFERDVPIPDGGVRSLVVTYTPDIQDGKIRGIFEQVADVTATKTLERELEAAKAKMGEFSLHDSLTGLPNRVLLLDRISQAIALAKRNNGMAAVVCIEVDEIKKLAETQGREESERLLKEIASRMRKSVRESDTVTHLEDGKFVVLASKTASAAGAEAMMNRIAANLRQPLQRKGATLAPTHNAGIALYPQHGTTPEALIASSERALQAAKQLGKNRYAIATAS